MTKQIEDYPELEKWLDSVTYLDDLHLETDEDESCCRSDVEMKLLEMQSKIDSLTEQNKELQEQLNKQIVFSRNIHHFLFEKAVSIPDGIFGHLNKLLKELNKESK